MTHEWKNWGESSDEEELPSSPPPPIYKRGNRKIRPMNVLMAAVTPPDGHKTKQPVSFGLMSKQNELEGLKMKLEELELKKRITESDIEASIRCAERAENDIKEAHVKLAHLSPSDKVEIEACNRAIELQSNRRVRIAMMKNDLEKINTEIQELSTSSMQLSDELSKGKGGRRVNRRTKTHAKHRAKHRSKKSNKTRIRR